MLDSNTKAYTQPRPFLFPHKLALPRLAVADPARQLASSVLPRACRGLLAGLAISLAGTTLAAPPAIQLHPDNPHYFLWRGKPTVLITSGEHYGAVLNLDFDYTRYLDTLSHDKLNLTRTWTGGPYIEPASAFGIAHNTLAPAEGRFLAPWARSSTPGYAGGGNKFDLNAWNPAYFRRLHDFVAHASRRGIVVEMNLFCPMYDDSQWRLSPFNSPNNVNGVGDLSRTNVYTLDRNGGLLAFEERITRKIVTELRGFDNVYYEICNEPYFGGVTLEWQKHIADVIQEAQRAAGIPNGRGQLISQNIANGSAVVRDPHPGVSIFNFHYATPPETVGMNFALNKVIGDNETGFLGTNNLPYRVEAWEFILAGGGLFNNLDYSFTAGHEDGSFVYPASQPGSGNAALRRELHVLRDFMQGLDFVHMGPDPSVLKEVPSGLVCRALVERGKQYALYLRPATLPKGNAPAPTYSPAALRLDLPEGVYAARWLDPLSGKVVAKDRFHHSGGTFTFTTPAFTGEMALCILRRGGGL